MARLTAPTLSRLTPTQGVFIVGFGRNVLTTSVGKSLKFFSDSVQDFLHQLVKKQNKNHSIDMAYRLREAGWPVFQRRKEGRIVEYPNKRTMIQEILDKNGSFDWYIIQPDKQNPDSPNARCVLFNFVERRRAELVIPNEWFQRYHRIAKLIRLAILHAAPATAQTTAESLRRSESSKLDSVQI